LKNVEDFSINDRLHATFEQCSHENGRINTVEPNLQCLAKSRQFSCATTSVDGATTPATIAVRACVAADSDCDLLAADFRHMELRLMAVLSGDAALLEAINADNDNSDSDPFELLARQLATMSDAMPRVQRADAKAVFYALAYGGGAATVVRRLACSDAMATSIVAALRRRHARLFRWRDAFADECRRRGNVVVTPIWGRRRRVRCHLTPSTSLTCLVSCQSSHPIDLPNERLPNDEQSIVWYKQQQAIFSKPFSSM
jgi:DNA polymerase-1